MMPFFERSSSRKNENVPGISPWKYLVTLNFSYHYTVKLTGSIKFINFDILTHSYNHSQNQDIERFCYPPKASYYPFELRATSSSQAQTQQTFISSFIIAADFFSRTSYEWNHLVCKFLTCSFHTASGVLESSKFFFCLY